MFIYVGRQSSHSHSEFANTTSRTSCCHWLVRCWFRVDGVCVQVRAMQIIDELETLRRGPYGGGIGHVSFTGDPLCTPSAATGLPCCILAYVKLQVGREVCFVGSLAYAQSKALFVRRWNGHGTRTTNYGHPQPTTHQQCWRRCRQQWQQGTTQHVDGALTGEGCR